MSKMLSKTRTGGCEHCAKVDLDRKLRRRRQRKVEKRKWRAELWFVVETFLAVLACIAAFAIPLGLAWSWAN